MNIINIKMIVLYKVTKIKIKKLRNIDYNLLNR
jgi:hypothetical protein